MLHFENINTNTYRIFSTVTTCLCWSGFAWIVFTPFKSLQKLLEKRWT